MGASILLLLTIRSKSIPEPSGNIPDHFGPAWISPDLTTHFASNLQKQLTKNKNTVICYFSATELLSKKHLNFGQGLEFLKFGQGNRGLNQQN